VDKESFYLINKSEALELANMFGSATSYKFINSVLDRLARECGAKQD